MSDVVKEIEVVFAMALEGELAQSLRFISWFFNDISIASNKNGRCFF